MRPIVPQSWRLTKDAIMDLQARDAWEEPVAFGPRTL